MTKSLRALVVLDEGVHRRQVEGDLKAIPDLEVIGFADAGQTPAYSGEDVLLLVSSESPKPAGMEAIKRASEERADRPVVVLCRQGFRGRLRGGDRSTFMDEVFKAGADDVGGFEQRAEELLETLQKAVARRRASVSAGPRLASVIPVIGPKGGTGKTITACNLAVALAETDAKTVVVDLDLHFGDVALGLRLSPEKTMYDLARAGGTLDLEKVTGFLVAHSSGVRVLLAPVRPDQAGAITMDFVSEVFALLREAYDYIVVDTSAGFPPEVITAVDNSTALCVVGMLDAFSLKDTKIGLETLELMDYDPSRIRVVLNRADSRLGLTGEDAAEILGRKPDVLVPSERHIPRSINEGMPIVLSQKRLPAARAFRQLAALYSQPAVTASSNGGGGLRARRH